MEATTTGLSAATEYVYRVVATNSSSTTTGTPDQAAETSAAPGAPTVTSVSPDEGPTGGGQLVTIEGANLAGAEWVEFGTKKVEASEFLAESATEIELESPERAAGTVDVTVTTPEGTSATSAADEYTFVAPPAVTAVSPAAGSTSGGTAVTITGLRLGGASKVSFGGSEVGSGAFLENTATTIKVFAPAHAAGRVHVQVTTSGGTSSAKFTADEYEFVGPQALGIALAGTGTGSVVCNGAPCASSYPYGSSVTLAAAPAADSSFDGFSGDCSGTAPCTLTMDAARSVTATFTKTPEPEPEPEPKPGSAKVPASNAQVSGNKALIKIRCTGAGACKGKITLKANVPKGKKGKKRVVIGKSSYSVGKGKTKTIKVTIKNGWVKKQLQKGKKVKAFYSGSHLKNGSLFLKLKNVRKHNNHGRP